MRAYILHLKEENKLVTEAEAIKEAERQEKAGFIPAFCRAVNGYFARFDSGGRSFWHPVAICCTVNFWRIYAFRICQR